MVWIRVPEARNFLEGQGEGEAGKIPVALSAKEAVLGLPRGGSQAISEAGT